MAYVRPIVRPKCDERTCSKWAEVEVIDMRNEHRGNYCKKHGDKRLAQVKGWEKVLY